MKTKNRALEAFETYMAQEQALGQPIKSIHFDNGGEFQSVEFVSFLKSKGLLLKLSLAYSPESNGLTERTNSTI